MKNNISLLVWRKDAQKIVGVMAMADEGRKHNHEGGAGGGLKRCRQRNRGCAVGKDGRLRKLCW